jgi:hypothetical protein
MVKMNDRSRMKVFILLTSGTNIVAISSILIRSDS